jgi:transposase
VKPGSGTDSVIWFGVSDASLVWFLCHVGRAILMFADVLFPHLAGVEAEEVSRAGGSVRILARARVSSAARPGCGAVSCRVHRRYERLLDTAIGGCEVVICLAVRRFFCLAPECAKVTFAEHVSELTSRHARRTPAVTAVLQAITLALGGQAGTRLTGRLAARVSRMTLIRVRGFKCFRRLMPEREN